MRFKTMVHMHVLTGLAWTAAAADPQTPINTDRPALTAASTVVPAGSLQFENGFTGTASAGQRTFDAPETLVRFGLASTTELRLVVPNYFYNPDAVSGFGDVTIGVKQQLGPTPGGFDLSAIISVSMPSGSPAISSHGYDPSVQFPWSHSLPANWNVAGMLSVYFPTVNGQHRATGETTFLFDRQFKKNWDVFAEYAGAFPQQGGPRHLVHFGTLFRPTPRQQLDFHAAFGLSTAAMAHFIGIGYSFRLQLWHR